MEAGRDSSTLRDYFAVARRRKWYILQTLVIVPLAAVLFSLHQAAAYQASAEVLLSRQNLAAALTGTPDVAASQPDRLVQTQADLARVPQIARRVVRAAPLRGWNAQRLLDSSSVSAKTNSDLLEFKVRADQPRVAERLATQYARQYTLYRHQLDVAAFRQARLGVQAKLSQLAQGGLRNSALYTSLADKEQQLRTLEALQASNAFLVRPADEAEQVQPKPVRNGVLGLALGLVLGLGLAFLAEALDTRVRSAEQVRETLDVPLLGRIPEPPRKIRKRNQLVMAERPTGAHAEAFRLLRTNLELTNLDRNAQMIMVTSALEGEGKSTTAANLALALARAGKRVLLADLDLRRPYLDRFLGMEALPGVTDVALGRLTLDQAVVRIRVPEIPAPSKSDGNGRVNGGIQNVVQFLPSGPVPPDPGEFIGTETLAGILSELRERAEIVLLDSAPLLGIGDALALSARVDALLVVVRLTSLHRGTLEQLASALATSPAEKLGFVLAGEESGDRYGYAGAYSYVRHGERERVA